MEMKKCEQLFANYRLCCNNNNSTTNETPVMFRDSFSSRQTGLPTKCTGGSCPGASNALGLLCNINTKYHNERSSDLRLADPSGTLSKPHF